MKTYFLVFSENVNPVPMTRSGGNPHRADDVPWPMTVRHGHVCSGLGWRCLQVCPGSLSLCVPNLEVEQGLGLLPAWSFPSLCECGFTGALLSLVMASRLGRW